MRQGAQQVREIERAASVAGQAVGDSIGIIGYAIIAALQEEMHRNRIRGLAAGVLELHAGAKLRQAGLGVISARYFASFIELPLFISIRILEILQAADQISLEYLEISCFF